MQADRVSRKMRPERSNLSKNNKKKECGCVCVWEKVEEEEEEKWEEEKEERRRGEVKERGRKDVGGEEDGR